MHIRKHIMVLALSLIGVAACNPDNVKADKEDYFVGSWNMGTPSGRGPTTATFTKGGKATFTGVSGTRYWAYDSNTNELVLNIPEERYKLLSSEKSQFTVVNELGAGIIFRK